jgi:hypothetical protein
MSVNRTLICTVYWELNKPSCKTMVWFVTSIQSAGISTLKKWFKVKWMKYYWQLGIQCQVTWMEQQVEDCTQVIKGKAIPLQALTGPKGSRRLRLPDFKTNGTWRWQGCQLYAPAAFTPIKYSWYSFLLEAELTPGLQCGWKDYVNEKFQRHHRESIRPSGLLHSASTIAPPCAPILRWTSGNTESNSAHNEGCLYNSFLWG